MGAFCPAEGAGWPVSWKTALILRKSEALPLNEPLLLVVTGCSFFKSENILKFQMFKVNNASGLQWSGSITLSREFRALYVPSGHKHVRWKMLLPGQGPFHAQTLLLSTYPRLDISGLVVSLTSMTWPLRSWVQELKVSLMPVTSWAVHTLNVMVHPCWRGSRFICRTAHGDPRLTAGQHHCILAWGLFSVGNASSTWWAHSFMPLEQLPARVWGEHCGLSHGDYPAFLKTIRSPFPWRNRRV